jgi:hypothetical protein
MADGCEGNPWLCGNSNISFYYRKKNICRMRLT